MGILAHAWSSLLEQDRSLQVVAALVSIFVALSPFIPGLFKRFAPRPKTTSHPTSMSNFLERELKKWSHPNLVKFSDITSRKDFNARKCASIPRSENILALFDMTVFGSAKKCLAIGETGVFMSGQERLPWKDFAGAAIKLNKRDSQLFIGDKELDVSALNDEEAFLALVSSLQQDIKEKFQLAA